MFLYNSHWKFWTFLILWTLKQVFWKTETFFKKLEHRFLVESTEIKNATFPYKTALSEANVKTNWIRNIKWNYYKERDFATNFFIFLEKFNVNIKPSYKELTLCTNYPNVHIHTFREHLSFIWGSAFPCEYLQRHVITLSCSILFLR